VSNDKLRMNDDLLGCVRALWLCTALAAVAPVTTATAQPQAAPTEAPNVTPAELQDLFDSYVMMQAQRQLRLTDAQLPQFVIKLKALQTVRRRADVQRLRIVQDLRRLTMPANEKVDEGQIRERLKDLEDLEARSAIEIRQAQANLDQILDVRQQGRFRVLEEQIERNKVDLMMRARQQANRRRNQ